MILHKEYLSEQKEESSQLSIKGLASPEEAVYRSFAESLKPAPPVDYVDWAEENVVFGPDNLFPGPYRSALFPFFRKILHVLQPEHPSRIVVLMGSAQTGKTVTAEVFVGANLDKDPGAFFYVLPSLEMAGKWVREKWKSFVRGSKTLSRIFPHETRSREATNTLLYKERVDGRGWLSIAGANSAAGLTMSSYRRQVHDDLGKWENNDHGDPEDQADKRSQAWGNWAKIFKISTPGLKGICRITKNYEQSNQQEYHVPCPHCGHKHTLEWENFKKSLYEGMNYADAHFTCPSCEKKIEHHHKEWMLDQTLEYDAWVAKNPLSKIEGFFIWCAYSRLCDWAYIAEQYFLALGNPEKEQTFTNDTLGLPYEQKGEAPPWKDIHARAANSHYESGTIPNGYPVLTAGVDVQGDRVEWLVKAWGPQLRRATVQHGVITGHITEKAVQDALDILLKRKWKNQSGREIPLDMLAIDANFETNDVKDWAKRHPENRVITIKGAREYTAPPMTPIKSERRNSGKLIRFQKRHWLLGVSAMKASLYKQLEKIDPLDKGYCAFPSDLDEDYYRQLCSETRAKEENKKTRAVQMVWKLLPGLRNEILDMEIYAEAAARRVGWHNMSDQDWEIVRADRETPAPDQQLDLLDPSLAKTPPPAVPAKRPSKMRVRNKGIKK